MVKVLHFLTDQSTGPFIIGVPLVFWCAYFGITGMRATLTAPIDEEVQDEL
jgi:hypothetical protein